MSPQRSNRSQLIEGTLRCLERLPPERITARAIADESGANLASIAYHFGSKDALVTEAAIAGLDRWLAEVAAGLGDLADRTPEERYRAASEAVTGTRDSHTGLARHYVTALARAQHDASIRDTLAEGFRRTRPDVAALLGLGDDEEGRDAAGLALALFHGLLIQTLLAPDLAIEGERMHRAQVRLRGVLPEA
ncbi:MAG: TetR/AcrR family transcriptional regulator [Streptomyces sp.]|uniref:TetR/AcrR family transcriptional regulator n=1 Tax=Streptomyces sp. TaxID=1931 RepID=UPI003D6B31BB